jgi:hypothetical protein
MAACRGEAAIANDCIIFGPKSCNDGENHLRDLVDTQCCVSGELCALINCSYKCGVYLCNKVFPSH